jgi:excisionase family DNA binding protein
MGRSNTKRDASVLDAITVLAEQCSSTEVADDDVIDVREAMALLKVGRNGLYDGCARGEIPHRRIGKLLRFSRSGLLRWLERSS